MMETRKSSSLMRCSGGIGRFARPAFWKLRVHPRMLASNRLHIILQILLDPCLHGSARQTLLTIQTSHRVPSSSGRCGRCGRCRLTTHAGPVQLIVPWHYRCVRSRILRLLPMQILNASKARKDQFSFFGHAALCLYICYKQQKRGNASMSCSLYAP